MIESYEEEREGIEREENRDDPKNRRTTDVLPSKVVVEATLILVQVLFGLGSVLGKLGVDAFNPVLFALVREASAGPLLMCLALFEVRRRRRDYQEKRKDLSQVTESLIDDDDDDSNRRGLGTASRRFVPSKGDFPVFAICGFFIFINQLFFILGEKLANATIGSAWQPTQPIMTATVAVLLGWEKPTAFKVIGILVAGGGAAFMVFYKSDSSVGSNPFVGNILFFFNCAGTAGYVIVSKYLMRTKGYVPIIVTAWSYICASVFMVVTGLAVNSSTAAVRFVCPPDEGEHDASCGTWDVPNSAIGPLMYWIFVQSVLCYMLMTWANKYAKPSSVVAYTALQPMTSALLSVLIVEISGEIGGIVMPGLNLLGGIGIVGGLFLVVYDTAKKEKPASAPLYEYDQARDPSVVNENA